jgi:hypothetical protein
MDFMRIKLRYYCIQIMLENKYYPFCAAILVVTAIMIFGQD